MADAAPAVGAVLPEPALGFAEPPPGFAEASPGSAEAVSPVFGEFVALGCTEVWEAPDTSAPLGSHAVDASISAPRTAAAAAFLITLLSLVNRTPCVMFFAVHDLYARQDSAGCMRIGKVLGPGAV
ncbi:hypothetical protein [Streptomyces sp. NBC_01276]|uniref:hypothetical protein n=1 Tax=Streptomyces sp. NBC_01276 TaxID=2903808 RepID=UPI00352D3341